MRFVRGPVDLTPAASHGLCCRVLVASVLLALAAADPARAESTTVRGLVVHEGGTPLNNVIVYAVDAVNGALLGASRSDRAGRVIITVPAGREVLVGVSAPRFDIRRLDRATPTEFKLVLRAVAGEVNAAVAPPAPGVQAPVMAIETAAKPAPPAAELTVVSEIEPPAPAPAVVTDGSVSVHLVRGVVTDEPGRPLAGVRVVAFTLDGLEPVASAATTANGRFVLAVPPGQFRLQPVAAGLRLERHKGSAATGFEFVMGIDTRTENVTVSTSRHRLRFRISDSRDPEYIPPPIVRQWLRRNYCLDVDRLFNSTSSLSDYFTSPGGPPAQRSHGLSGPGGAPIYQSFRGSVPGVPTSVAVRRLDLPKYWWLWLLYRQPPRGAGCDL